jgi:hypothetical protein
LDKLKHRKFSLKSKLKFNPKPKAVKFLLPQRILPFKNRNQLKINTVIGERTIQSIYKEGGYPSELSVLFFLSQQLTRQACQEDHAERQRCYAYLIREFHVGKEKCKNGHQHQR